MSSILKEIRDNHIKRDSCELHQFDVPTEFKLGQYYFCKNCGWKTRITEISYYARGYRAAGGDPNEIMNDVLGGELWVIK